MTPEAMQLTLDDREVPISRTVPRDESRMLRRPIAGGVDDTQANLEAWLVKLVRAWERAGIKPGEAFYVSRVPPVSREPLARTTDPQTSHTAARSVRVTAKNQCGRALTLIAHQQYTADTLYREEGIAWQRVADLHKLGLIEPLHDAVGRPVTRPTEAGRDATVWMVSDAGRARLAAGL